MFIVKCYIDSCTYYFFRIPLLQEGVGRREREEWIVIPSINQSLQD